MVLNSKVLAISATLICGSIALPVCLTQTGQTTTSKGQKAVQSSSQMSDKTSEDPKSIEKVTCEAVDITKASQHLENFLKRKRKDETLYSLVSCTNNFVIEGVDSSFLGKNWMGIFPKSVLNTVLLLKTEGNFELIAEISIEEGISSTTVTTFSNPNTKSSIRGIWGQWDDILEKDFQKKIIPVTLVENIQISKDIYLLIDVPKLSTEETVR